MKHALNRRQLVRSGVGFALATPLASFAAGCGNDSKSSTTTATGTASLEKPPRNGDEALDRLLAGNERFLAGETTEQGQDSARRALIAGGQKPFATILGCSDSRVPPELIFDQGLGELFVVRIPGNSATEPIVRGSAEYGAEHLHTVLLMVLGHQRCGAVTAAAAEVTEGAHEPGSIDAFIDPITPVVEEVSKRDSELSENELVERSITANVERGVAELEHSDPILSHLVEAGDLKVVGAEYHLSGKVTVLGS